MQFSTVEKAKRNYLLPHKGDFVKHIEPGIALNFSHDTTVEFIDKNFCILF